MSGISELLDFVTFTHQIRNIKRAILLEAGVYENDSEHMYQLALTAWFLIEKDNLKLDKYRCVAMALVQDITEVYAGDTNAHASAEERLAHETRSKAAAKELKKAWPTLLSVHELIAEYEARQTPESQFIYALDKLLPILNIYLYDGGSWKEQGIDFAEMRRVKVGKVDKSPEVNAYYKQMLKVLEDKPEVFGSKR
jgi:putative hydrolase of HD superfamily